MSVCAQTEDDSASEEVGPAREMYRAKGASKAVRVLTVLAYLLSVSLAAILLSVYYVCVWKSPDLPLLNRTEGEISARRGDHPLHPDYAENGMRYNYTGRGNTTVNETDTSSVPTLNFSDVEKTSDSVNNTTEIPTDSNSTTLSVSEDQPFVISSSLETTNVT